MKIKSNINEIKFKDIKKYKAKNMWIFMTQHFSILGYLLIGAFEIYIAMNPTAKFDSLSNVSMMT